MAKLDHLLSQESEARRAAAEARTAAERERHLMRAERYADQAWILAEETPGCPHIPSEVWAWSKAA